MLEDRVAKSCLGCFGKLWFSSFSLCGLPRWPVPLMVSTLTIVALLANSTCTGAMVFGEDDRRRQTYYDMYHLKSVGVVVAGSYVGVGTLVMGGDIMVTSAHVIYNEVGLLRSRQVVFFPDGNRKKRVAVDLSQSRAGNVFVKPGQLDNDWVILRLERDILADNTNQGFDAVGVLPVTSFNFDQVKDNIIHVSFDFRRRPFRKVVNRDCQLYQKNRGDMFWGISSILLHDCDLERHDNSGSPLLLLEDGNYYLLGLHQGGHKDFYGAAFNPRVNPNFAFGVNHRFQRAIRKFINTRSGDGPAE